MGLTTNTMGSSKSFGFSRGRKKVLTTYTFPAGTSTWTAPAAVTSLASAVGKGANGVAASWIDDYLIFTTMSSSVSIVGESATLSFSTISSELNTQLAWANSLSTTGTYLTSFVYWVYYRWSTTTSTWKRNTVSTSTPKTYRKTSPYISYNSDHIGTGNYLGPSPDRSSNILGFQYYQSDTTGAPTNGFGLTFIGGSIIASNTTFNNVTVSPGTTYSITNNGSLTIEYYV